MKICKLCSCSLPDSYEEKFCESCLDDLDRCNPFNQWMNEGDTDESVQTSN